jgi:putative alpha-1,2-mannosidase
MWAYSFDVVHNIPRLIRERGGNASFVKSLDEHFDGGHNDHTNEVRGLCLQFEPFYTLTLVTR